MGGLCITSMADKLDKKSQRVLMQTPENQSQTEGLYMEVLLLKKILICNELEKNEWRCINDPQNLQKS